jgi:hypothetical protein
MKANTWVNRMRSLSRDLIDNLEEINTLFEEGSNAAAEYHRRKHMGSVPPPAGVKTLLQQWLNDPNVQSVVQEFPGVDEDAYWEAAVAMAQLRESVTAANGDDQDTKANKEHWLRSLQWTAQEG